MQPGNYRRAAFAFFFASNCYYIYLSGDQPPRRRHPMRPSLAAKRISSRQMKTEVMKKNTLLRKAALALAFGSLLGLQNCSKELPIDTEAPSGYVNLPVVMRDNDPLSEQAYHEAISDEYEEQGRFVYEHLRYRAGAVAPEEYIPSISRQAYMQAWDEARAESMGKAIAERVDGYYSEGLLTQDERALILDFCSLIAAQEGEDLTFGQAWYLIRDWEAQVQGDPAIGEEDKRLPLVLASALRNVMKYAHETGDIVELREDGCLLGRRLSCWEKAVTGAVLDGIKAFAKKIFASGLGAVSVVAAKKAAFVAAGAAAVIEVVKIYLDPKCRCREEGSEPVCETVKGVSLLPDGCEALPMALEQTLVAWGHNTGPGSIFEWTIHNGVFPENNGATSIQTIFPEVRVRQNHPDFPIMIAVKPTCAGGGEYHTTPPINLLDLINDVGEMMVMGPQEVYANPVHEHAYEFWGSWLATTNSVLFHASCTPHGQVTETGAAHVKVRWLSDQPATLSPKVTGIIQNLCSQQSLTRVLDVTIH
jgi:hypothetical protein